MATRNFSEYDRTKVPNAENMCFGIVVSERNPEITESLLKGAVETLESYDALPENIHVKRVAGTFELVYGAHQMTLNDGYDAVIALGAVIRGETPNFDCICNGIRTTERHKRRARNIRSADNKHNAAGNRQGWRKIRQ